MSEKSKSSQNERAKWLNPVLDALKDLGGSGRTREVIEKVAVMEKVPDYEREKLLKDGKPEFDNKIRWAREFLFFAGLLGNSERGTWVLTKKGQKTHLNIDQSLEIIKKYNESKRQKSSESLEEIKPIDEVEETSLLEILKKVHPKKFESLCKLLLREHGFENVVVTKYSKDGGIDGFGKLKLNSFVNMKVAFQCKRYEGSVGRSEVADFRGSISGEIEKAIFITTGHFSEEAKYSANLPGVLPIELVDGQRLIELFKEVKLGLVPKTLYDIDYSFFEQYM
jgi:restriction system protein